MIQNKTEPEKQYKYLLARVLVRFHFVQKKKELNKILKIIKFHNNCGEFMDGLT